MVDAGVRALLADDAADERAVPGLDVEAAAAVVVGLVLVVPSADGGEVAPRAVQDAVVTQPRVGDVAGTRPQPRVEHEHVGRVVSREVERRRQVRWCRGRAHRRRRRHRDGARRTSVRSVLGDDPEVPGHALGEVHAVRPHRAALVGEALGQPLQVVRAPTDRRDVRAVGRSRPGPQQAAGRRCDDRAAEDLQRAVGDDALHVVEAVLVELEEHRVRSDEAQLPGVVGRHGDAPTRQLRLDGAQRPPVVVEIERHEDQTLKTVPRSGNRYRR